MTLPALVFYACALGALVCALLVVSSRNVFHSALFLAGALASLAVVYLLLDAEFLAVVQLLIYVGAVIVLVIFAVMLTAKVGLSAAPQTNRLALPAGVGAAGLLVVLQRWLLATPWAQAQASAAADRDPLAAGSPNLQALGLSLFTRYVFPLEITALILFAALVGAVLIARKDRP